MRTNSDFGAVMSDMIHGACPDTNHKSHIIERSSVPDFRPIDFHKRVCPNELGSYGIPESIRTVGAQRSSAIWLLPSAARARDPDARKRTTHTAQHRGRPYECRLPAMRFRSCVL